MTISYKWLSEYLPVTLEPERLSRILTSIGLEVESLVKYEEAKGGLKGLVIGEVLTREKHPNADKLSVTTVNTGTGPALQIVCGAPNVEAGQKVVVAPVGTTIYPTTGEPLTMKVAKIRSVESYGMICAEDEIGLGDSHAGILVLPSDARVGQSAAEYFHPYDDYIYEIGLTPNRMDAMSHWGVARDVCAYLSHHDKKDTRAKIPNSNGFRSDNHDLLFDVKIENEKACPRYSGISLSGITVAESPKWLQQRLKSIGLRPINNIVDITNYIQHETGQPLHAFDADQVAGKKVIVKNLPEGTLFTTLDEKERKLSADDLMICDAAEGMCIAGVFGGLKSGVTGSTKNIFLESACFEGITIRKTSFRHGLRTDAASRFEKGTDISATLNVLKRAALMIREICGGAISSEPIDVYPDKREKEEVAIKYHYLKKLSGKNYHPDAVKNILTSLGFEVLKEGIDELRVAVPYHKTDISLPADLVEEVLRIDGLDNVAIPDSITITPAVEDNYALDSYREKAANYLVGLGFYEIMTNSITNAAFFNEAELEKGVKMLNSLSAELNIMRPSMLETGLQSVAHNLNRRNNDLQFFEFGKTYSTDGPGIYQENEHLCLYITGRTGEEGWRSKPGVTDFYVLKGIIGRVFELTGVNPGQITALEHPKMESGITGVAGDVVLFQAGVVHKKTLGLFDIKQPVYFADFNWSAIAALASSRKPQVKEIPKYPAVQRDLAMVVSSQTPYADLEKAVKRVKPSQLTQVRLFDVFESEKLGAGKKSMAVSFTFQDLDKTLTDKEIDVWMTKIMSTLEKEISAEIRK
ncbi:MAG: phenylalanine--tRNA ligase subunit beta [Chitinophagaceae bacterium]|nr:MAG: phenylalanine--tRNA ligase subunit beta [Chitinophagaceae bacterium]